MSWSVGLRALALLEKLLLAGLLLHLLHRGRRPLPRPLWNAWLAFSAYYVLVAVQTGTLEGLQLWAALDPSRGTSLLEVRRTIFDGSYLLFPALAVLVPASILLLLGRAPWVRHGAVLLGALGLGFAGASALGGIPGDWVPLVTAAGVLTVLAIVGYLSGWAALLLQQLAPVEGYFLGFFGARTLFELLTPIQEGIFALLGREAARSFWDLHLTLQVLLYAAQAGLVALLIRTLPPRGSRAPGGGRSVAA